MSFSLGIVLVVVGVGVVLWAVLGGSISGSTGDSGFRSVLPTEFGPIEITRRSRDFQITTPVILLVTGMVLAIAGLVLSLTGRKPAIEAPPEDFETALRRLHQLQLDGILSEEEYQKQKTALLRRNAES